MEPQRLQRKSTASQAASLLLALFLLLPSAGSLGAQPVSAVQPSPQIVVEPELLQQLSADETASYMIYFREQAELSAAQTMNWHERGRFVVSALQEVAARSQARVRRHLDLQDASYQPFWIDNVIVVEHSSQATFDGLLAFPEIAALRTYRLMHAIEPLDAQATAGITPLAIEDNLSHVGADEVWALGFRGEGLVVANIDTGVRYTH